MATRKSPPRKHPKLTGGSGASSTSQVSGKAAEAGKSALYLYGITRRAKEFATYKLAQPGVDGANPVSALPCGEFLAWESNVSRSEFVDSLARNMENLEWLANASVRHQAILNELGKRGAVLPARFGLIFSSQQALARDVASRRDELLQQFRKVAEADEWGVKVFRLRTQSSTLNDISSGADYMHRKADVMHAESREKSAGIAEEIRNLASELSQFARDMAPGGSVSSGQPGLEWQISILLPRSKRAQFDRVIRRTAQAWQGARRIEVTGPWPPYSFVKETA